MNDAEKMFKEEVLPIFSIALGTVALSFVVRKATKMSTGINTLSGEGAIKATLAITGGGVLTNKLIIWFSPKSKPKPTPDS